MYVQLCICQLASFCFMSKYEIYHCSKAAKSKEGKSISRNACCCRLASLGSWLWDGNWFAGGLQGGRGGDLRNNSSWEWRKQDWAEENVKLQYPQLILQGVLELKWPLEWFPFGERQLDLCIPKSTSNQRTLRAGATPWESSFYRQKVMPGKGCSYVASAANEPSNRGSKNSGLERAFGKLPTAYTTNFLPRSCIDGVHVHTMYVTMRVCTPDR